MVAHLSDLIDSFLWTSPFVFEQIRCGAVAFRVPVLIVSGVLCFDISTVFCGVEQFLHFLKSVCKLALDLLLCKGAIAVEAVPIDIVLGSFFVNVFAYGFKSNYLNIVKIMFFRSLFTVLWGLLFIIPGIIKAYEYSMIPYLLSENPDMDMQQAFDESRRMTYGQKWQIFVLDLSFIGWNILSSFTLGLLGIFFVSPYMCLTKAGLYRRLRGYNDYKY